MLIYTTYLINAILLAPGYYKSNNNTDSFEQEANRFVNIGLVGLAVVAGVIVAWIIVRKFGLIYKKQRVKKFINEFKKNDPFWDVKDMNSISADIFTYVQAAWEKQNFYCVTGFITDELKLSWERKWAVMKASGYGFHCGSMDIDSIAIIGAEDSSDNNKDTFTAEISGNMKRYFYHRKTRTPFYNHTNEVIHITDIYHFVRRNNKWLLNSIQYNAGLLDILKTEVKVEKPGKPGKPCKPEET